MRRLTLKQARELGFTVPETKRKPRAAVKYPKGLFEALCREHGLPKPVAEFVFHPERLWRLDWAWPLYWIALEIDGVSPEGTRHQRIAGYLADQEKGNEALLAGWRVLHCSPRMVESGEVFSLLKRAFGIAERGFRE